MLKLHTHVHKPRRRLWHYLPFRLRSAITTNLSKCWYLSSGRGTAVPRAGRRTGAVPGDTEGRPKETLKATRRKHYQPSTHSGCFRGLTARHFPFSSAAGSVAKPGLTIHSDPATHSDPTRLSRSRCQPVALSKATEAQTRIKKRRCCCWC